MLEHEIGFQKMGSLKVNIPGKAQVVVSVEPGKGTSHLWEQDSGEEALGCMVWDSNTSVVMDIQKIPLARSRGLEWRVRNDVDSLGTSHKGKP